MISIYNLPKLIYIMSQTTQSQVKAHTQEQLIKQSDSNLIRNCCLVSFIIISLISFAFLLPNVQLSQNHNGRRLQFDYNYIRKKEQYASTRKSFLKDKQEHPGIQLLQSNLAYDEEISANLKALQVEEYKRLDQIYHFDDFKRELPFCVIVQGFNFTVPHLFELTLNSIFNQNYSNYKAVLFNFGKQGNELIIQYFRLNRVKRDNYIFIKNKEKYGTLENIITASKEYCQKDSISLNLVGNVELIGRNVFKTFNAVYQSNKIGMAYSNFYNYNENGPIITGYNTDHTRVDLTRIRSIRFAMASPVTYFTEHALKIKVDDLKDASGQYLDLAYEQALFFPILDISCGAVLKVDGFHLALKGLNSFQDFKKEIALRSEHSFIARNKKRYPCDEAFYNSLRHRTVVVRLKSVLENKAISEKRSQQNEIIQPRQFPNNFDATPEEAAKLGEHLYKDKKILKARAYFEKQRINFIKYETREDSRKMIKYNLRLGAGMDKQQQKIQQYQNFQTLRQQRITIHPKELPFCIVIQSLPFENPFYFRFEHILNSIFNQNYTNFFAVIINQNPKIGEYVTNYLSYLKIKKQRYVYLQNYEERSPAELLHTALTSYCSEDSYTILLNGAGELLGRNVLKIFNKKFQQLNAGVLYSNNYIFKQSETSLHYGSSGEYQNFEKNSNIYRKISKRYSQLLSFKTELYYSIDVKDFQDESGKFLDGSLEQHLILSLLQLSCSKAFKIMGVHYVTNQDVLEDAKFRDLSQLIKNKKSYTCVKNKKLTLSDATLNITGLTELDKISDKHKQKQGQNSAQIVPEMNFLKINKNGQTIQDYLYASQKLIRIQRKKYQIEREKFLSSKTTEDSRQLIQFNLKIRKNEQNKAKLQAQNYRIIKDLFKSIDTAPETPICVIVDRFNFELPFKFQYALNSIFNQNYTNFFVVIVGDGSKASNTLLRKYLHFYQISNKHYVYLQNKHKLGTMEVTLDAVNNFCSKDSLVTNIAGEDELIGRNVFKTFNAAYNEGKPLIIYSNLYYYSQGKSLDYGKSGDYQHKQLKVDTFRKSQPKYDISLFYHSSLLRKIEQKDLKYNDTHFYQAGFFRAITVPMFQSACGRIKKIRGVHYLYNKDRKLKTNKDLQQKQLAKIASGKPYECSKQFEHKK